MKSHLVFYSACGILLQPIVRFCIRHALKAQDLDLQAKHLFVTEAIREIRRQGEKENVSRVAAVSGLHRREVTALMKDLIKKKSCHEPEPLAQRKVLGIWQSAKGYQLPNGKPRPLSCAGNDSEFAELVRSVSQDLNPYTILCELERAEIVQRKQGVVTLKRDTYIAADLKKGFQLAGADIADLLTSVEGNLLGSPPGPNLHIKTHYDNIVVESLPQIAQWFSKKGKELHAEARKFLSKFDKDLNPELSDKTSGARVGIGTFSFAVQPQKPTTLGKTTTQRRRKKGRA